MQQIINCDILIKSSICNGPLAQWLELPAHNRAVIGSSPMGSTIIFAGMAELVDALDLGSSGLGRVGSSPIRRTDKNPNCLIISG